MTFIVRGKNFILGKEKIDSLFNIDSFSYDAVKAGDPVYLRNKDTGRKHPHGFLTCMHKQIFSPENDILSYENQFIDLLANNYELFQKSGAESYTYFWEIYYDGGQCNFSIFSAEQLARIQHCKVDFPVSVYLMTTAELEALLLP